MIYIWYLIYMVLQCTWGFIQTFIGLIFFLVYFKKPHSFYKGCINTRWDSLSGLSLGLFIFTPNELVNNAGKHPGHTDCYLTEYCSQITVHEYGHTYQSLMLGPFYIIPGICSLLWAHMNRYQQLRKNYGVPYSFCWVESWANSLGEKMTGLPSIGDK